MEASVDIKQKPFVWYYVETTWRDEDGMTNFMAHLVNAQSPREAEKLARAATRRKHPDAHDVEFFMSRRLTDKKARAIGEQFDNGTWEGWRF